MDRTNGAGHVNHRFVAEDAANNIPPTELTPEWHNGVQEELAYVIESMGITLSGADTTQLKAAITRMIEARVGDYVVDTGTADAYVIVLNPAVDAPLHGMEAKFRVANANTQASTLNAGGGAKALVKNNGQALAAGDLPADTLVTVTYDAPSLSWRINGLVTSQTLTRTAADLLYLGQAGTQVVATAGGTADALTAAFTPAITGLNNQRLFVRASAINTTATPTFSPNGIVAATIVKGNNLPLVPGDIAGAGYWLHLVGDQTLGKWVLLNPATGLKSSTVGEIFDWAMDNDPDYGILCNGATLTSTLYADLFNKLVKSGTVTMAIGTPGVFTWANHGLSVGSPVRLKTTGNLLTGVAVSTTYYVIAAGLATNVFQLSTTRGGSAIALTGTQTGVHTAIHAPYGCADDLSTFNVPNIPAGYTTVQAANNEGTTTVGEVIAHSHTTNIIPTATTAASGATSGQVNAFNSPGGTGNTGGPANLAAGLSVRKYIRYK